MSGIAGPVTESDQNPPMSAVVEPLNTVAVDESLMSTKIDAPGSAVPLIIVGKMLVGLVISSMDMDGGVESNVKNVGDTNPWLPAVSVASAVTV